MHIYVTQHKILGQAVYLTRSYARARAPSTHNTSESTVERSSIRRSIKYISNQKQQQQQQKYNSRDLSFYKPAIASATLCNRAVKLLVSKWRSISLDPHKKWNAQRTHPIIHEFFRFYRWTLCRGRRFTIHHFVRTFRHCMGSSAGLAADYRRPFAICSLFIFQCVCSIFFPPSILCLSVRAQCPPSVAHSIVLHVISIKITRSDCYYTKLFGKWSKA